MACDCDDDALDAAQANAELNHQEIEVCRTLDDVAEPFDVILAADILYDRENRTVLETFPDKARFILIADSRVKEVDLPAFRKIAEMRAATLPDLNEAEEFNQVRIFRALGR